MINTLFTASLFLLFAIPALSAKPSQLTSTDPVPAGIAKSDWQNIRSAHEAWKNQFHASEGGWQAVNSHQQWTTRFDGRGFIATPHDAGWTWGLAFQSYGFADRQTRLDGTAKIRYADQRLSYQWSDDVEEWFVNDSRGLEHGFIITERPSGRRGNEALCLSLLTQGSLKPQLAVDGQTIQFCDPGGASVLNYSGLKVWDANGTVLPSRFQVSQSQVCLLVEESTARYPLTIDPIAQQAYLKASNTGVDDFFGNSVAVSIDTVVVGANGEDSSTTGVNSTPNESASNAGAAYVFVRSGSTWSQQAYLKASNPGANDFFGYSVAVDGDTVVVGAYGEDSSSTGVNSTPNEGASLSGAVYVFVRNGTTWSQQSYLKASNTGANDSFGISVAVSGNTVVTGANGEASSTTGVNSFPNNSASYSGAAYVFLRTNSTWSQQAYLKAANTGADDEFGTTVALSADTVVVGAPYEDSNTVGVNSTPNNTGSNSGAAYVFMRSGSAWSQQAYLKSSNNGVDDNFGWSVAVSGNTAVIGANYEDSSTVGVNSTPNNAAADSGAAYVFLRSGTVWSQQAYLKASNTGAGDQFGWAVAVYGDTVVVGATSEASSTMGVNSPPDENAPASGAVYGFVRFGTTWSQRAYLKSSNTSANNEFGISVSVSGNTVVVGATGEDSSTTGVNSIPNESASGSGAAYIFTCLGPTVDELYFDYYTAAGLSGAEDKPEAIPYHDCVPNLLKFAFNMDASRSDVRTLVPTTGTVGLPVLRYFPGSEPVFRYEFIRRRVCGLTYTPQFSATLAPGSWQPTENTKGSTTVTPINADWERVVIEQPYKPSTPKRFFRVQVTED